jgi:hypothetical protein
MGKCKKFRYVRRPMLDGISLVQGRVISWAFVNTIMNLRFVKNTRNYVISSTTLISEEVL